MAELVEGKKSASSFMFFVLPCATRFPLPLAVVISFVILCNKRIHPTHTQKKQQQKGEHRVEKNSSYSSSILVSVACYAEVRVLPTDACDATVPSLFIPSSYLTKPCIQPNMVRGTSNR